MQSPHLQTFIQPIGQKLVCVILQCVGKKNYPYASMYRITKLQVPLFSLGGGVTRSNLDPHAEVLLALNRTCLDWTSQWLRLALSDATAPLATDSQKEYFSRMVLRERTNKRQLCETLKEFSMQCQRSITGQ